jgi:hypothetical protein
LFASFLKDQSKKDPSLFYLTRTDFLLYLITSFKFRMTALSSYSIFPLRPHDNLMVLLSRLTKTRRNIKFRFITISAERVFVVAKVSKTRRPLLFSKSSQKKKTPSSSTPDLHTQTLGLRTKTRLAAFTFTHFHRPTASHFSDSSLARPKNRR